MFVSRDLDSGSDQGTDHSAAFNRAWMNRSISPIPLNASGENAASNLQRSITAVKL